jgi:sugar/nucleoside kinase (ribokinase family)
MRILVAGELNPDLVLSQYSSFPTLGKEVLVEDLTLALGSASAICAAGLQRLGNAVSFVSKVGADPWGDFCVGALAATGVDVRNVLRDPDVKTGLTVSITSTQDRALVTYLGSIAMLRSEDIPDPLLADHQHLHVSSYFLQQELQPGCRALFKRARSLGATTSLDPGFDPSERWEAGLVDTLKEVDIFLPNEVELAAVGGSDDPVSALRNLQNGRTITVAKLGKQGCITLQGERALRVQAYPVDPVDTTGAGDSFNAGFLHAWLQGRPVEEAMRFAAVCGALSTLGVGGTAAQPDASEAERHFERAL